MIEAIFFDVFGTLLDMRDVPREELKAYGDHLRKYQETGEYQPLELPAHWHSLPAFPDAMAGLERLGNKFRLYTFSNGPVQLTVDALWSSGIRMRAIDVRQARGFKPVQWIYPWACGRVGFAPGQCLMVTANQSFGDLEGAKACGMSPWLIRGDSDTRDLHALAHFLEC